MRDPRPPRKLVIDAPLSVELVDVEAAVERARRCAGLAFDLLYEDELALSRAGEPEKIHFGRWLTNVDGTPRQISDRLRERLLMTIEAVTRSSFEGETVGEIVQVQSLAAITQEVADADQGIQLTIDRTNLLRGWSPRAQLLVPVMAALLSVEGRLPPLGAWGFSTHAGLCGDEAEAFGTHKEPDRHASERLISLDVLGGDSQAAVGMTAMVTGTRHDSSACLPERREHARDELAEFGIEPPSTPAEHLDSLFGLARATRDLITRSVERGSRTLRSAAISARELLSVGVPRGAVAGPFGYGPLAVPHDLRSPRYWPGSDAATLRSATRNGVPLLALAFDSATLAGGDVAGLERLVAARQMLAGRELAETLSSPTRLDEIPALKQVTAAELDAVSEQRLAHRLGIRLDPAADSVVTLPIGHVKLGARGNRPADVGLLLHSTLGGAEPRVPSGTMAWTTNFELDERRRPHAIILTRLHRLALQPVPPLGGCTSRLFRVFDLHRIKPGAYKTRCYLRVIAMMANLVIIGEGRATQ